jgi:hypothetical protein
MLKEFSLIASDLSFVYFKSIVIIFAIELKANFAIILILLKLKSMHRSFPKLLNEFYGKASIA